MSIRVKPKRVLSQQSAYMLVNMLETAASKRQRARFVGAERASPSGRANRHRGNGQCGGQPGYMDSGLQRPTTGRQRMDGI